MKKSKFLHTSLLTSGLLALSIQHGIASSQEINPIGLTVEVTPGISKHIGFSTSIDTTNIRPGNQSRQILLGLPWAKTVPSYTSKAIVSSKSLHVSDKIQTNQPVTLTVTYVTFTEHTPAANLVHKTTKFTLGNNLEDAENWLKEHHTLTFHTGADDVEKVSIQ